MSAAHFPLCGDDEYTGKNYDHRKQWILRRPAFLGAIFAIDICAYAIMSSHFHTVLRVMAHLAQQWSDEEVLRRVGLLCPSTTKGIDEWPKSRRQHFIKKWSGRLSSLSWSGQLHYTGLVAHLSGTRNPAI